MHDRVDDFAASGTYHTSGDKRLLHDTESGERLGFRWSLYRGTLRLRRDEMRAWARIRSTRCPRGRRWPDAMVMKPWRVR